MSFSTRYIGEYQAEIRVELSDTAVAAFFTNAEIIRAVEKTVSILSRLIPKKGIIETTITIDIDNETLAIATNTGTTAYKPIKKGSIVLKTAAGVTKTLDTDYTVNYMTGVITEKDSGLPDAADYKVSYDLDPQRLDISSLLSDYIKIARVEYPVGDQPPTYLGSFDLIEDFIILHKDTSLTEDYHLRIYYDARWTPPAAAAAPSYLTHLDDAVVIGAAGQCLIFKAEKYVQSAITELGLVNTAADSMATPLADINVALDKVATHVTEAGTALGKVPLYLETNAVTDNAKDVLSNITDDILDLRTAIKTALDKSSTYLTSIDTPPSAHDYLVDGDDKIITVNVADRVAEKYADYARATIQLYTGLVTEATTRLSNLRSYIEEAEGWMRMGSTFIAEAGQRLGQANTFVNEAIQRVAEVNAWAIQADRYSVTTREYMNIAGRYLASGQAKINEFYVMLGFKPELTHAAAAASQPTLY